MLVESVYPADQRVHNEATLLVSSGYEVSVIKSILCYIGCLNPQDGVDYLLRALYHLQYSLGRDDFHCVIMGTGDSLTDCRGWLAN